MSVCACVTSAPRHPATGAEASVQGPLQLTHWSGLRVRALVVFVHHLVLDIRPPSLLGGGGAEDGNSGGGVNGCIHRLLLRGRYGPLWETMECQEARRSSRRAAPLERRAVAPPRAAPCPPATQRPPLLPPAVAVRGPCRLRRACSCQLTRWLRSRLSTSCLGTHNAWGGCCDGAATAATVCSGACISGVSGRARLEGSVLAAVGMARTCARTRTAGARGLVDQSIPAPYLRRWDRRRRL